jgi:hypothetical protein
MAIAIFLLALPFSPQGAAQAVGVPLLNLDLSLPPIGVLALGGHFGSAMIKSVYAWAVVLLLTRLLLENVLATRKRYTFLLKARTGSLGEQPSLQGYAVPVPVSVESRSRLDSS